MVAISHIKMNVIKQNLSAINPFEVKEKDRTGVDLGVRFM